MQGQSLQTIGTELPLWDHWKASDNSKIVRRETYMDANSAKENPTAQAPNPARIDP